MQVLKDPVVIASAEMTVKQKLISSSFAHSPAYTLGVQLRQWLPRARTRFGGVAAIIQPGLDGRYRSLA